MDNPRAGTFCLLLAVGLGIWSVFNSLDQGNRRLVLRDPSSGVQSPVKPPVPPSVIETLDPDHLVEAKVVDPLGKPIGKALVRCGNIETRSDHLGRFKLPSGSEKIEFSHQEYFPATISSLANPAKNPPAGEEESRPLEEIVLVPGCRLSGTVYNSLSSPLPGTRIDFESTPRGYLEPGISGADGTWKSPLLQPGLVKIFYSHAGHIPRSYSVNLAEDNRSRTIETVLSPGKPVRIRTLDEKGAYLPEASVWADRPVFTGKGHAVSSYLGRTDDLGFLQCALPTPVPEKIRVRRTGYREKILELVAEKTEVVNLEVTLERGLVLTAHAIDSKSGLPIRPEAVEVELQSDGDFRPASNVAIEYHSLDEGEIRIGLPPAPGKYRLRVSGENDCYGLSKIISFDGRKSPAACLVRLSPARSRFQGVVTFEQRAVPRALVELLSSVGTWSGHTTLYGVRVARPTRAVMSTHTDSAGAFRFRQFEPGSYRIRVSHPHHATYQGETIELPLADPARRHPLRLAAGAVIEGRVLSPQAKAIAGVPVVLSSSRCSPRSTFTDPQGRYSFSGLPAASDIRIEVGSGEETEAEVDIEWTGRSGRGAAAAESLTLGVGQRLAFDLLAQGREENGGLHGSVTLDGNPLHTELSLLSLPEMGKSPAFSSDANGAFSLSPLPPGKYRLSGRGFQFERELSIPPGEDVEFSVSLKSLVYDLEIASNATGAPLGIPCRVTAEMTGATASQLAQASWTKRAVIAASGQLVLKGLLPVNYRLRLEAENHVPATVRINPGKGRSGRATLRRGKKTRLNLKKPTGEAFRGEVAVVIADQAGLTVHDRKHQVDGELELPVLPPGSYQVVVRTRKKPYKFSLTIAAN